MVILTATRLPTGYRLIAATSCCAIRYRWYLYRNQQPIGINAETTSINNVIAFDLTGAIVSGRYTVRVTHVRSGFNDGKELWDERSNGVFLRMAARHSVNIRASCHVHNATSNFQGSLYARYVSNWDHARLTQQELHIRLHIQETPELEQDSKF